LTSYSQSSSTFKSDTQYLIMSLNTLLTRGVKTGAIVSYTTVSETDKPVCKRGLIAGIVAGLVLLIVVITIALLVDRRRKRKARQGERMVDVVTEEETMPFGAGQPMGESEARTGSFPRPLIIGQGGKGKEREMERVMPISIVHPGEKYDVEVGAYAGAGYAGAVDEEAEVGRQGTQYYRNQ
jgi:hypothetical protein